MTPFPSAVAVPVTHTPTATQTDTPTATQTDTLLLQHTLYNLSVRLNYERHHLAVSQSLTYVNQSYESLHDLLFIVEPNRQPNVFGLNSLSWVDGRPVKDYTFEGARLWVPLPAPLPPGASINLHLSFELNIPAQPGPFGYTLRQTNLGDWYPFIPPYHAERGWLEHEPAVAGEHLVYDVADHWIDIYLDSPAISLTIAASGLVESDENWHRYRLDAARGFAWSVSSEYVVFTKSTDSTAIASYVFPEHVVAGEAMLSITADAMAVYSELFGPYPHTNLVVVEADFADGMEYDGLYFLGQEYYAAYTGTPQGYLTAIAVHETSHQWWYGLVGNDQAIEPWLDESLAIYSELLFYEALYPDLVDWWWEFRVARFNPVGWVNSTIYDYSGFRPYVNAVYLRGARFMQELRNLVGKETFLVFLSDYAAQGAHGQMTAEDFFSILAKYNPINLDTLISSYFTPVE